MLEILLKLTFHKVIFIQIKRKKIPDVQTTISVNVPSFISKCQKWTCFMIQKFFRKSNSLSMCVHKKPIVFIHFVKSTLKEPCLVVHYHSTLVLIHFPLFPIVDCHLDFSGRVHLRLFKLTGCLMKTLKEKNAVGIPIILFLQRTSTHLEDTLTIHKALIL